MELLTPITTSLRVAGVIDAKRESYFNSPRKYAQWLELRNWVRGTLVAAFNRVQQEMRPMTIEGLHNMMAIFPNNPDIAKYKKSCKIHLKQAWDYRPKFGPIKGKDD